MHKRLNLRVWPKEYGTDAAVRLVYDTLVDRGEDEDDVRHRLDAYDGDLWWEIFGPAVDRAAEVIGIEEYQRD